MIKHTAICYVRIMLPKLKITLTYRKIKSRQMEFDLFDSYKRLCHAFSLIDKDKLPLFEQIQSRGKEYIAQSR